MDNSLISIIIPVYNSEKTLNRCIDSILSSTYKNIEVILVDDGSNDHSANICQKYVKADPRVYYIYKDNKGVSAARNVGLELCRGEYIAFVDSDDYIEPEMYEKMLSVAKENKDAVIVCQWRDLKREQYALVGKYDSISFAYNLFAGDYENVVVCSPWNKLYPYNVIKNMRFKGDMAEDEDFNDRIFCRNLPVVVIPNRFYHYCYNENSLTNSIFSAKRLHFLDVLIQRLELYKKDDYILRETEKLYCNIYIEYYYQCIAEGILFPHYYRYVQTDCFFNLIKHNYCNLKFYIRMIVFFVSPKLYKFLTKG